MIDIGFILAFAGTLISIYGVIRNNIYHDHHHAMVIWMYSNPILLVYFIGQSLAWWNGGLSSAAMAGLYLVFTYTNWKGLS